MQFQFFLYHIHTFSSPLIRFSLPPFSIHFSFPLSFIFSTPLFLLSSYSFLFHSPVSPHFPHSLPLSFIFLCIPPSSLLFPFIFLFLPLTPPFPVHVSSPLSIPSYFHSISFPSLLHSLPCPVAFLSLPPLFLPLHFHPFWLHLLINNGPFKESTPT